MIQGHRRLNRLVCQGSQNDRLHHAHEAKLTTPIDRFFYKGSLDQQADWHQTSCGILLHTCEGRAEVASSLLD